MEFENIVPEMASATKHVFGKQESSQFEHFLVGVIGFGSYGKALASRLEAVGVDFAVGTRDVQRSRSSLSGIDERYLMSYKEAVMKADVVVLAIPFRAYDEVVQPLAELLANKVVVDVSNAEKNSEPCHAEYLSEMLPSSKVVKAFNTISAWSVENDVYGASRSTFVCGNDAAARQIVVQLAQDMGFTPVERGRLRAAAILEKKPLQLFPAWRTAFWITLIVLIAQIVYIAITFAIRGRMHKVGQYLGLKLPMVLTGWMALWLLGITFLPGCIAGIIQLTRGTKYSIFPNWLDRWMKARKQLGLFALMFATMHCCITLIMLGTHYFTGFMIKYKIPNSDLTIYRKLKVNIEFSMLCGVISTTLMAILGITSLPSVNQSMSWREWDFIQSKLGYFSMLFGFLHVVLFAYKALDPQYIARYWRYGLPSAAVLMLMLPMIVLALKIFLMLPGINGMLRKIRSGWDRKSKYNKLAAV